MRRGFSLLAILVVLLSAMSFAAEQKVINVPVDIYGVVHVSAEEVNNGLTNSQYLSSNSSRIGFRGDIPVQGSVKVIWQIESQVNIDSKTDNNSTQLLSLRDSFLGLDGRGGTVKFGHMDSPMKLVGSKTNLFSDRVGDSRNITDSKTNTGWDNRLDNDITYITPTWNGFRGMASRSLDDGVRNKSITDLSLDYTVENLYVAVAAERHEKALTSLGLNEETGYRLGASYKIKNFTINGLYQLIDDVNGVRGSNRDIYGLGISYQRNKNVFKAQYYVAEELNNTDNTGAEMIAVGYDRNFTDKITGYISYAFTHNDDLAAYNVSGGGHGDSMGVANGNDIHGTSVGLTVKF